MVLDGLLLYIFEYKTKNKIAFTNSEIKQFDKITKIGDNFLSECKKITEIDLSYLKNITHIGDNFLCACENLENINFEQIIRVCVIGTHFMYMCKKIKNINLSALTHVKKIGFHFLSGVPNINKNTREKLIYFNKNNNQSWKVRKNLLLIRNFAQKSKTTKAMQMWSIMRCVIHFLASPPISDIVLIVEEERMLEIYEKIYKKIDNNTI